MDLLVKTFDELSTRELYDLLRLRVDVFVVEQHCPYPELDGRDEAALHVWLQDETGIQAYLRIMDRGVSSEYISVGRVIAAKRRMGLGTRILAEGIRLARERFSAEHLSGGSGLCQRPVREAGLPRDFRTIPGGRHPPCENAAGSDQRTRIIRSEGLATDPTEKGPQSTVFVGCTW